jgi:hypothetical protein
MRAFLRHALLILTQSASACAVLFLVEAYAYMEDGRGINPVAAGFMVCLLLIIPHMLVNIGEDND